MTARPRDRQRRKVYDAEHRLRAMFDLADHTAGRTVELFGSQISVPIERRMGTVESVSAYLDAVLTLVAPAAAVALYTGPLPARRGTSAGACAAWQPLRTL
ncbi:MULTISPECIES: hypothetical protein [Nocardia]|uniref:hypothetical protein n=1 Tax=Nocardia TaxID=1817 RepID=UPI0026C6A923